MVVWDSTQPDHPKLFTVGEGNPDRILNVRSLQDLPVQVLESKFRATGHMLLGEPELVLVTCTTVDPLVRGLTEKDLDQTEESNPRIGLDVFSHRLRKEPTILRRKLLELSGVPVGVESDQVHDGRGRERSSGVVRGHLGFLAFLFSVLLCFRFGVKNF